MIDRREPAWMREMRAEAGARMEAMSWPTASDDEWRRTDVSRLDLSSYMAGPAAPATCPREGDPGATAGWIRFEAGRCIEVALAEAWREKGVRLVPMELALEEFEIPLHRLFHDGLLAADNRIAAWHFAQWSHGAFVWVPAGLQISAPLIIELAEQGAAGTGQSTASAPHVSVALGEGARASVVQRISGAPTREGSPGSRDRKDGAAGPLLVNAAMDIQLGAAASLELCEAQDLGPSALYFRHARATVARDASLRHLDASFGARLVKSRIDCSMDGRGSEAILDGAYFCRAGQHMDIRTVQRHRAPSATSRATYKGAVTGGRTVFQGLIEVAEGASGTDAFLSNKNLILGDAARADSIPTLKIGNNDVRCSHGSTTGRLSDEELFYLESRGFSPNEAREMLVVGYFEDLLDRAPEAFREDALDRIRTRLRTLLVKAA
jgi:Fe-S cluster assembly protein SufD